MSAFYYRGVVPNSIGDSLEVGGIWFCLVSFACVLVECELRPLLGATVPSIGKRPSLSGRHFPEFEIGRLL